MNETTPPSNVVQLRKPGDAPPLFLERAEPSEVEAADEVYDVEVLDEEEVEALHARAVVAVRAAAVHPRTVATARNASYLVVGATLTWHRVQDRRPSAVYKHGIRTGLRTGDEEKVRYWEERRAIYWKERHQRRMDRPDMVLKHLKTSGILAGGGLTFIGLAMAIADRQPGQILTPFKTFFEAVRFIVTVLRVSTDLAGSTVFLCAAAALTAITLWNVGRRNAALSSIGWVNALQDDHGERHAIVTCDTIVLALQHLRIPELKKAFKDGWVPAFRQQPIRDGRGYHAVFDLPLGVTAEMVADLREVFARNLHRAKIEVWPSDAETTETGPAGYLDLWVADSGALSKPAPAYPLLHEGTADVFEGVPGGVSPRGDVIMVPIIANNFVAGGQMGQGKSNACRVILLGCALDPLCQIDAFVFANNGDFDAYKPRLANYRKGVDDDTAYAALNRLRWLYGEVARREGRLSEVGAKKVTRGVAEKYPDLRPIVSLYSECHELFGHSEVGEEAAELALKTAKRARKTGIVLGFDTQSSRKEAIPPSLVELVSINACFYVKSWRSNDGFLGDGSFQAGIRATELRPKRDRGTSLITGVSDNAFELLKWYFVEVNDDTGYDAAAEVIARAVDAMADGTIVEVKQLEPVEERDLLDDLADAFDGFTAKTGEDRVKVTALPQELLKLAPHWPPYKKLNGKKLLELLDELEVAWVNPGNNPHLEREALRAAISRRQAENLEV